MIDDVSVRQGSHADLPQVATMLAAAFQDDPVMAFIFPDPAVRRIASAWLLRSDLYSRSSEGARPM